MKGIKFRALLRFGESSFLDVGSATAVNPSELVGQIRQRRDDGEIEIEEESEVWVIPVKSFMERTAVPTDSAIEEENGREVAYKAKDDLDHGEDYLSFSDLDEGRYRLDGYVRAIKPEMAARVAASLKGGRMDAKNVILVPEQTVNRFEVGPS